MNSLPSYITLPTDYYPQMQEPELIPVMQVPTTPAPDSALRSFFDPLLESGLSADIEKIRQTINIYQLNSITLPKTSNFSTLTFLLTSCPSLTNLEIECPHLKSDKTQSAKLSNFLRQLDHAPSLLSLELIDGACTTVPLRETLSRNTVLKELIFTRRLGDKLHYSKWQQIAQLSAKLETITIRNYVANYSSLVPKKFFDTIDKREIPLTINFQNCHPFALRNGFTALAQADYCQHIKEFNIVARKKNPKSSTSISEEINYTIQDVVSMIAKNKYIRRFSLTGLTFDRHTQKSIISALETNTHLLSVCFDKLLPEYDTKVQQIIDRNMRIEAEGSLQAEFGSTLATTNQTVVLSFENADNLESTGMHETEESPVQSPAAELQEGRGGRGLKRRRSVGDQSINEQSDSDGILSSSRSPSPTQRRPGQRDIALAGVAAAKMLALNEAKSFIRIVLGSNLSELDIHEGFQNLPAMLPHCKDVQIIRLKCKIDDEAAMRFAQAIKTQNLPLRRLVLDGCEISSLALQNILLALPHLKSLCRLRIRLIEADEWTDTLAAQLNRSMLTELCLEGLQLAPEQAENLGKKIAKSLRITQLELSEQASGSLLPMINQLADRQGTSPLRKLGLHWINAQDSAAAVDGISRVLSNAPELTTLELTDNHFDGPQIDTLIHAIESSAAIVKASLEQWTPQLTQTQRARLENALARRAPDGRRLADSNDQMIIL